MSITNMGVLTGIQFPLANAVVKLVTGGQERRLSDLETISTGFAGGLISGIVCCPMELVMIQQQRFGGSIFSTPGRIASSAGVPTLLSRGLITSCGREGLFTAGYLGLGPVFAEKLSNSMGGMQAKVIGAILAGLVAGTLSHPMDTIKTCMQGDIERKKFTTVSQTAKTLLNEEGIFRFFRGWGFRTGRMSAGIFIINECKTRLTPLLFPHYFK